MWFPKIVILCFMLMGAGLSWAEDKEVLWVDRFSQALTSDGLPEGWTLEKEPGKESKISIEKKGDDYFVRLLSVGDTFGLEKKISLDIRKYPYLSWRWKVATIPPKGDIRKRDTDDEAGQIYVLFPKFPTTINTRSVGYIWDTQAPVDLHGTSTAYSKMRYVVLQSGPEKLNQWITETRNVYEDYKKLFQEEPPEVGAVLLYINTQHTKGSAECFYDDIFFSSKPPEKK